MQLCKKFIEAKNMHKQTFFGRQSFFRASLYLTEYFFCAFIRSLEYLFLTVSIFSLFSFSSFFKDLISLSRRSSLLSDLKSVNWTFFLLFCRNAILSFSVAKNQFKKVKYTIFLKYTTDGSSEK